MNKSKIKYFSGLEEVKNPHFMKKGEAEIKYPGIKAKVIDSFNVWVGHSITGSDQILPITRIINYAKNPSLHKCDGRCISAKGSNCECSCGGINHGSGK